MLHAKRLILIFVLMYLFLIALITLSPGSRSTGKLFYRPKYQRFLKDTNLRSRRYLLDFVSNVALFVPLGMGTSFLLSRRHWLLVLLGLFFGFAISALIETAQLYLGRVASLYDIYANGAGYILGYLLVTGAVFLIGIRRQR